MPALKISAEVAQIIATDAVSRFLRYVRIDTKADDESKTVPSSEGQWTLLQLLEQEMRGFGLKDVSFTGKGCLYGTLPANCKGVEPFTLIAHVDTSPEASGKDVSPVLHRNYDGETITFADDPQLTLSPADSPELLHHVGGTIITGGGTTLLGGDDKAGVAEIMSALAVLSQFPEILHGEIRACITTDEEIGDGPSRVDLTKITRLCYTIDGGEDGELEAETFDARKVTIKFTGRVTHPGTAYGVMINAGTAAAKFVERLPAAECPERTKDRDGFFYVNSIKGEVGNAELVLLVRDYDAAVNDARLARLYDIAAELKSEIPGLGIEIDPKFQYPNMREYISQCPEVVDRAVEALQDAGIEVKRRSIRGGTDGAQLSRKGHPCPNLFAGEMMIHSTREWIAVSSMENAVKTILHLANRYVIAASAE